MILADQGDSIGFMSYRRDSRGRLCLDAVVYDDSSPGYYSMRLPGQEDIIKQEMNYFIGILLALAL